MIIILNIEIHLCQNSDYWSCLFVKPVQELSKKIVGQLHVYF